MYLSLSINWPLMEHISAEINCSAKEKGLTWIASKHITDEVLAFRLGEITNKLVK